MVNITRHAERVIGVAIHVRVVLRPISRRRNPQVNECPRLTEARRLGVLKWSGRIAGKGDTKLASAARLRLAQAPTSLHPLGSEMGAASANVIAQTGLP